MPGAKDYMKEDVTELGDAFGDLLVAVTDDGVGTEDFDEAIAVFTKAAAAVNEIKAVPGAAGLHILSGASDKYGDHLLAQAIEAEEAEEPPVP